MGFFSRIFGLIKTGAKWLTIAFVGLVVLGVAFAMVMPSDTGTGSAPDAASSGAQATTAQATAQTTVVTDGGSEGAIGTKAAKASTATAAATATSTPTTVSGGATTTAPVPEVVQVRVSYDGEWSGSIGPTGSSRTVDGSGERTFDVEIEDGWDAVSAVMQKQDDGDDEMVVQLIYNGEVVQESSTSAAYGTASVTQSFTEGWFSDTVVAGSQAGSSDKNVTVRIEYDGAWSGNVGTIGSSRSVEGSGSETLDVTAQDGWDVVSATIQKQDDGSGELTVQILVDGEVVQESSTSAEFGVVMLTHSASR